VGTHHFGQGAYTNSVNEKNIAGYINMETAIGTQAMTAEIATLRHNDQVRASRKCNTGSKARVIKYYDDGLFCVQYIISNAQPWFLAREITEDLGYTNGAQAIAKNVRERHHKKLHELIDTTGLTHNERTSTFITEPGVYALIMKSRLPKAEEFQDWVYENLLPNLRKRLMVSASGLCNEFDLHTRVVNFLRTHLPDAIMTAPMGELQDSSEKRHRAWKLGYTGGMPDLLILNHNLRYNSFSLEFKNPHATGQLSANQSRVLEGFRQAGSKVLVSTDYDEIVKALVDYFADVRFCCSICCDRDRVGKQPRKYKSLEALAQHRRYFHRECIT
jgi:hypothetical protein